MTSLVHIDPGQWVLAYIDHFGPTPDERDLVAALNRLQYGGSGWDVLRKASDQFDIFHVERVMPKTFTSATGKSAEGRARSYPRYLVVAAAETAGELTALRDKLFAIGVEAELAIEAETIRLVSEFEKKTRAEALAKVHSALPHIFGRSA